MVFQRKSGNKYSVCLYSIESNRDDRDRAMVSHKKLGVQNPLVVKGGHNMYKVIGVFGILLLAFVLSLGNSAFSSEKDPGFQKIKDMNIRELTVAAKETLNKKYPGENWEQYHFPKYVYTNEAVQAGYKIAVKESALLAKFPCYCFCGEMGHKNLAHCFLKNGVPGKFDDHASECNICYTQAMKAFLWNEQGAHEDEMQKAFKELYEK